MKRTLLFWCATIILITACQPIAPMSLAAATASPSATSSTNTSVVSVPTATTTPTQTTDTITQTCLDVLPSMPANFTTRGIIPLQDYQTGNTVFLDLESNNKTKIPYVKEFISNYAISPDGKILAYKIGDPSGFSLILTDALNNHKQVIFVRKDDFALYSWLNNQELLLRLDAHWVIFNPVTKQERSYSLTDFPDYNTDNPRNTGILVDPQVEKAVYAHTNGTTALLDLGSQQVIAQVQDAFDRPPVAAWAMDGSEVAIVGTIATGKHASDAGDNIFEVSRNGQITQLTHLAEHYGTGFNIHSLSWSPDSRYIAFWMWYPRASSNDWVLAILDIATKKTTDYCLSTDPYATNGRFVQSLSAPLWSPDGSKILIEHRTANTAYYVVLVDVQKNIAFQFAQNMFPFGWMIKTP